MLAERIRYNLEAVQCRIADAARRSGRPVGGHSIGRRDEENPARNGSRPWSAAESASSAKTTHRSYGPKSMPSPTCEDSVHWHLIGHLQTNKVKKTLPMVRLIHSVDSLKLLRALNDAAPAVSDPPGVCLQVNTSDEPSKHGWTAEQIVNEAEPIAACRAIPIVGLMTMAALGTTAETARGSFARLRELRDRLKRETGLPLLELSMGMSNDFETAIEEGATLLRIGSALFEGIES